MTYVKALEVAVEIARLIHGGARRLSRTPMGELPLMVMLPMIDVAAGAPVGHMDPSVKELLLFGSAARGEAVIHDVDLMMFDGGFYSEHFPVHPHLLHHERDAYSRLWHDGRDAYSRLRRNLRRLMEDWFGISPGCAESGAEVEALMTPVDLHVLPIAFFTNRILCEAIAQAHRDLHFFQNAFSNVLRYDEALAEFVPVGLEYFEKKYGCDLSDLRS